MADINHLRRKHKRLYGALRWKINNWATHHPAFLNLIGARVTVLDAFGAPGDALLTGIVCRTLKERFPRLKINCLTPHPMVLERAPYLDSINQPETFFMIWFSYTSIAENKDGETNVLKPIFDSLGIHDYEYRAEVHLTPEELAEGRQILGPETLPMVTFNLLSKERVKNWPAASWELLLKKLQGRIDLVQLGDNREPVLPGVRRLAGQLSLRQSMSVLAHSRLHLGPDSFLMHVANGLNVPAVIIFGGSRTPKNAGYARNINLYVKVPCGPCYIHDSLGQVCPHNIMCMDKISVEEVWSAMQKLLPSGISATAQA